MEGRMSTFYKKTFSETQIGIWNTIQFEKYQGILIDRSI